MNSDDDVSQRTTSTCGMTDKAIIHVTVTNATQDELKKIRNFMEDALSDYDGTGKIVVSDERMELQEIPVLDDYADELADRIADRLESG